MKMKKKRSQTASRFSRGHRVSAKSRRGMRRTERSSRQEEPARIESPTV